MPQLVARALITIHRLVRGRPAIHRRLVSLVGRTVGERRVSSAILELVRTGDVVWDVGANIGAYTGRFLELVGATGHVVAIEPVPSNAAAIAKLGASERLTLVEAALAGVDGEMPLVVSGERGETSTLGDGLGALIVRVARGDTLVREGLPPPDFLKVDVEGFEGDVLDGMVNSLPRVRSVVVEIHFTALARRGRPREALRIIELLHEHGFAVRWIDPSHLVARRS
jgi:FkbM family methyltransferase